MAPSPAAETNRFPASQKTPCVLWKPTAFYRFHKSPPINRLEPDKYSPFQTILFEIYCNNFHQITPPALWEEVYFLQVSPPISCTHFSSPMLAACPGHLILLGFQKLIIRMNSVIVLTEMKQGIWPATKICSFNGGYNTVLDWYQISKLKVKVKWSPVTGPVWLRGWVEV